MKRYLSYLKYFKLRSALIFLSTFLISFISFGNLTSSPPAYPQVTFNKIFQGTGTYKVESTSITITSETGSGPYTFTSATAGTQFSGNNVNGTLTYGPGPTTIYGTISRLIKEPGNNITGFYFVQTDASFTQTSTSLHNAFIFVDPADDANALYSSPFTSRSSSTSSDPVDAALNKLLGVTSPSITLDDSTLGDFNSCVDVTSASQSITVGGADLTADILLSFTGSAYELSTDNSNFSPTLTLTQSGGSVAATTVYIRMKATATNPGAESLQITSTGATTAESPLTGTVTPASVGGTASATNATVCTASGTTISLTGNTGTIQWQKKVAGFFVDITDSTRTTLLTGNLTQETIYRAKVTSGICAVAYSNEVTVAVSAASVGGTASASNATVCTASGTTISLTGNTGTIQWQKKVAGFFVDITDSTRTSLLTGNLTQETIYRAKVTSGVCAVAYSNEVTVAVSAASVGGTASASNATVCTASGTTISLTGNT
ncbi:hypothetical protein V7S79_11980, partial [Aquirufa sp. ROCK-SH2]